MIYSGEEGHTLGANYHFWGINEYSGGPSVHCGQILQKNPGKGQSPPSPPFWQFQDFGRICTLNPPLNIKRFFFVKLYVFFLHEKSFLIKVGLPKGRLPLPKRMNFRKSSKRPLAPPPSFSESYVANFFRNS